jgi:Ca-activated chloride channel family protein
MITFAQPTFLYLLLLLPLLVIFLLWANRRRSASLARLGDPTLVAKLSPNLNRRGRRWQTWLWFAAFTLLVVALARPQWGSQTQVVEQEGLQVMVALDVSKSMLAEDIKPNRLERAKLEIDDLMTRLGGDEIGLVLFSGASFIQFPLTSDYTTARMFVDGAHPEIISRPGTVIGDALRTAMSGFDPRQVSQKVIILITDGEDHAPDTLDVVREIAGQDVLIYAIGFGSPQGEPIPEYNAQGEVVSYKKDKQGNVVLSKLDEKTLQQIAQIGHGQYYRAAADGSELAALLDEINQLQKAELATRFETFGIERFQGFLLAALAAMVISELIPDRHR